MVEKVLIEKEHFLKWLEEKKNYPEEWKQIVLAIIVDYLTEEVIYFETRDLQKMGYVK